MSRIADARVLVVALLVVSCGEGTEPRRAATLGVVTPPPATARSGVVLTPPLVVEVRDQEGAPFARGGTTIAVTIAHGGGTLAGTTTQTTNGDGRATFPDLVITGTVGPRTLRFSAEGLTEATSTIALVAGPAATVEAFSPVALQATVATAIATPPAVIVKDASGNAAPGVSVDFAVSSGGGNLIGASQTTNASGVATLGGWTLPTAVGQYTVTATTPDVAGGAISFVAVATPDVPSTIQTSGGAQAALYGSRLRAPLEARVVDKHGNPHAGVVVTWRVVEGAGTVEPIEVTTTAQGLVRANYQLGIIPGTNVVRASVGAHNLSADFQPRALGFTNEIEVSTSHSCGLDELGYAHCWGRNTVGHLGDGTRTSRMRPTAVAGSLRFRRIRVGDGNTCAITIDNVAYCWGLGSFGSLGDGTTEDRLVPTPVAGGHRFAEITTSDRMSCGQTLEGAGTLCWGSNEFNSLGVGSTPVPTCHTRHLGGNGFPCSPTPLPVAGGRNFVSLGSGSSHVCGLTATQELWCWGSVDSWGGPGPGTSPVRADKGLTFSQMTVGAGYTCGIVAPTSAYCWGAGHNGTLGIGVAPPGPNTSLQINTPTPVAGNLAILRMDGGTFGTCAVVTDGRAFCWGWNGFGGVGDGTTTTRYSPAAVSSGETFTALTASGHTSCGRIANGQVYCWGRNADGQLGNGGGPDQVTPVLARP